MTSREIRQSFLDFFEQQAHRIVPSSSLVPTDDPTLLFTNAGMNQFKDVFLGRERRDYRRAASSQKCMRVSGKHNDLDNVGPSLRHHTFFEMLGNFSFGDYFKEDAIAFAWTLLTDRWALEPERLYPSIFKGESGIPRDAEAHALWRRFVPADRIAEFGLADNFWQMGDTGPCGRCSEIYYQRSELPCAEPVCRGIECSCERFVEIWNNVFMEFERRADGSFEPLPAPSIDTGMGLERITAVMQGKVSNYDTDLFSPIIRAVEEISGAVYGPYQAPPTKHDGDVSLRVIADHLRAMTFLIADGVVPSNEWRGYVLRKIMRRAMRHGKHLSIDRPFLQSLSGVVVEEMGDAYPELRKNRDVIASVILVEEERFDTVLRDGLPRLEAAVAVGKASGSLNGAEAFRLYDTFGLPFDFIEDTASTHGLSVDREGFDRAMEAQRGRARASGAFESKKTQPFVFRSNDDRASLEALGDRFDGYTTTEVAGLPVVALFDEERRQVADLAEGDAGYALLERTPFYVEAGGQVSDTGRLSAQTTGVEATVEGMARLGPSGPRAHRVRVARGSLREGDQVVAEVAADVRAATRRNHTATHLLHAALRTVLGPHVKQAGSLVAPDRLRFDFVHYAPLTREQLDGIERIVSDQIARNVPVQTEIRSTQEAIDAGAMALFGEKYGDQVRVVSIDGFSMELCGGTHCAATGEIGAFVIVQETGVAAGVRRIEALTGSGAVQYIQQHRAAQARILEALGVREDAAVDAIHRLQGDVKRLTRETNDLKIKAALGGSTASAREDTHDAGGIRVLTRKVEGLEKAAIRTLVDSLKARLGSGVVVIGSHTGDKVTVVVSVTPDLVHRIGAGELVKQLAPMVGGGGGGRPDFAEAGGKLPERLDEMLAAAPSVVKSLGAKRP